MTLGTTRTTKSLYKTSKDPFIAVSILLLVTFKRAFMFTT